MPVFRDGRVGAAPVVVRLHAVAGPDGVTVMAGGNGRVLDDGDDPRRPTARLAKDVWVIGADRAGARSSSRRCRRSTSCPSVPTRAADALFWIGRAAERAEAIAKTARVIAVAPPDRSVAGDATRVVAGRGGWPTCCASCAARRLDGGDADGRPIAVLDAELAAATQRRRRAAHRRVLAEAATVGEYLSVTAGRVLAQPGRASRNDFADGRAAIDVLDACIADLAAFAGLWDESTVRGPAWRFGDLGRRIERALVVLGLVDACLRPAAGRRPTDRRRCDVSRPATSSTGSALEVLLAANESLVAYRRHHRSDVELGAGARTCCCTTSTTRARTSPRVDRLAEHVAAIDWTEGRQAVADLAGLVDDDDVLAGVGARATAVGGVRRRSSSRRGSPRR